MSYSVKTDPQLADQCAIWDTANGTWARASLTSIKDLLMTCTEEVKIQTQYSAPNATGFSVSIGENLTLDEDIHLILTPADVYADGTLVLPSETSIVDKQIVLVNSTKEVTALTIDGNGASAVIGAPATLEANDFFTLKYDITLKTWYRVG